VRNENLWAEAMFQFSKEKLREGLNTNQRGSVDIYDELCVEQRNYFS